MSDNCCGLTYNVMMYPRSATENDDELTFIGSRGGLVSVNCGQVRTSNYIPRLHKPYSTNEMKMDLEEEEEMNNIIIDDYEDSDIYQVSTVRNQDHKSIKNSIDNFNRHNKIDDTTFDTYDFIDDPGAYYYNVDNGES